MTITQDSLAAARGSAVKNVQFTVGSDLVRQKILIIGSFDPTKTGIVADEPLSAFSPEEVGALTGFGFPLHRMSIKAFKGSNGDIETVIIPQDEDGGGVQAEGTITFVATSVSAGTIKLYIANDVVDVVVASGDADADIATKCAAAINADDNLPVTAIAALGVVTITAKDSSTYGNEVTVRFNIKQGDAFPDGLTSAVVVDQTGGVGTPDISTALDALGVGDAANENFFTRIVHSYLLDTATMSAISTYVGEGNDFVGLYDKLVSRPFTALTGDITPETAGLTALIVVTDLKLSDRANGILAAPGSANHPSELAAWAVGIMARKNNIAAQSSYIDEPLSGADPGVSSDRWTDDYDLGRDLAVKSGISPTFVQNGVLTLQNIVTFYRPVSVAVKSNSFRSMRNISIIQNMLDTTKKRFSSDKWKDFTVVEDVAKVTDIVSRLTARDPESVKDDLLGLIEFFAGKAWIFSADFAIQKLKEADTVTIRGSGNGFDNIMRNQLSGEGAILDTVTQIDTAIGVG